MHLISYVESETGAHFLPPTRWIERRVHLALPSCDGRHYARMASSSTTATKIGGIDLHDPRSGSVETELAGRLDALAVDRAEARRLRAERYAREMPIGDQLDAVLKTLVQPARGRRRAAGRDGGADRPLVRHQGRPSQA